MNFISKMEMGAMVNNNEALDNKQVFEETAASKEDQKKEERDKDKDIVNEGLEIFERGK